MSDLNDYIFINKKKIYLHKPQKGCPNKCRGRIHLTDDIDFVKPSKEKEDLMKGFNVYIYQKTDPICINSKATFISETFFIPKKVM